MNNTNEQSDFNSVFASSDLHMWVESENPGILTMLNREVREAGLQDRDIAVLELEVVDAKDMEYAKTIHSFATTKWETGGYVLEINQHGISEDGSPSANDLECSIRYGLALIKSGRYERRKSIGGLLGKPLLRLYERFWEEPRARRYADKE